MRKKSNKSEIIVRNGIWCAEQYWGYANHPTEMGTVVISKSNNLVAMLTISEPFDEKGLRDLLIKYRVEEMFKEMHSGFDDDIITLKKAGTDSFGEIEARIIREQKTIEVHYLVDDSVDYMDYDAFLLEYGTGYEDAER